MAFVLVCLTLVTLALTATVSRMTLARQHLRWQRRQAQAAWLAESAVELATARLRQNPEYDGEMWQVPRDVLADSQAARVSIELAAIESSPEREIRVTVTYPEASSTAIRREKRVRFGVREGIQP